MPATSLTSTGRTHSPSDALARGREPPTPTVEALRRAGHDVTWARTDHPGAKDVALLELAESDRRVLVTLDKDLCQIAIQRRWPLEQSGVILFRVHPAIPDAITPLMLRTLAMDQRWAGHATVVAEDRVLMVRSGRTETS